jgi:hypothetical protein
MNDREEGLVGAVKALWGDLEQTEDLVGPGQLTAKMVQHPTAEAGYTLCILDPTSPVARKNLGLGQSRCLFPARKPGDFPAYRYPTARQI